MLAQLVVIAGPDTGGAFKLEDGQTLIIGRGQDTHTQLKDARASRKHCLLQVDSGKFLVLDEGSAGGTFVNGDRVTRHELKPGDVLKVGATEMRLQLGVDRNESTILGDEFHKPKPIPKVTPLKDLVGQSIAHFELKKVLATGANGMVFLAHDSKEDRPAAVKLLWPETSKHDDEMQRFVRAMKTMMPIRHENIIQIYAAGKNGPYCWVAMEYVDGESLTEVIQHIGTKGMLDWRHAFRVAVHIGRALETAYEHQIIHRNITPQNILLRKSDRVAKLGDLMLAKALEGTLARPVTQPGQLIGDLVYMPPERTRTDAPVDCRADIYSLGATVYALLTGRPPFEGDSLPQVVSKIRQAEPVKPKQFQLSIADRFQDCVLTMLAKRPDDRYETPSRLLQDLERIARFENVEV
ncbi:MAG TPA: FHA domain-containing serine/threonine-protein kinase [Pirellulales bacterium]|jgi:serine/threonine protein kinase|nr:FHA domain-containing serine/threonine-protein kinase [Pirellulales bacterium]